MVNTAVFASPLGLIHAVIKKPPHTAKKIAESSNLVDFIVNLSFSSKLFFSPYPLCTLGAQTSYEQHDRRERQSKTYRIRNCATI